MSANKRLARLMRLARREAEAREDARPPAPDEPPIGFATRVAARWAAERKRGVNLWERLCWFGAAAAIVVWVGAATLQSEPDPFVDAPMSEPEIF